MELAAFIDKLRQFDEYERVFSTDSVQTMTEEKLKDVDESIRKRREEIKRVNQFRDTPVSTLDTIYFSM